MSRNWRNSAIAISLATTLSACNSSGGKPRLPVAPAEFGSPVPLREIAPGKGAKATLAEERADHIEANRRLENDGAFYSDVRENFGAKD